jgi:hypothetical protein
MTIIKANLLRIIVFIFLFHIIETVNGDEVTISLNHWWKTFSTSWTRYDQTTKILQIMEKTLPNNMNLYSIGKTVQGREMWVIKLGNDLQTKKERGLLVTPIKIVANMHGDETLGRALLLMFCVDILIKYHKGDER